MSIALVNAVLDTDLRGDRKVIMIVLADYADDAGFCFPGQERIAKRSSVPMRTLQRMLKELEDDGWIVRQRRTSEAGWRTSDGYYLPLHANLAGSPSRQNGGSNPPAVAGTGEPSVRTTSKKERATAIPADWAPTDEHRARALRTGVNLEREVERFKAHAEAHDRRAVRWNAAFTQWLITAEERKVVPFPQRAVVPEAPKYKSIEQVEADRLAAIERSKVAEPPPKPDVPISISDDSERFDPWA